MGSRTARRTRAALGAWVFGKTQPMLLAHRYHSISMLERCSSRGTHSDRLRANSAYYRGISRVTYAPFAGRVSRNLGFAQDRSMSSDWGPCPAELGFPSGAAITWPTCALINNSWRRCLKRSTLHSQNGTRQLQTSIATPAGKQQSRVQGSSKTPRKSPNGHEHCHARKAKHQGLRARSPDSEDAMTDATTPELYPQYCFHLSPTINRWCHFRITDLLALRSHRGFQGGSADCARQACTLSIKVLTPGARRTGCLLPPQPPSKMGAHIRCCGRRR